MAVRRSKKRNTTQRREAERQRQQPLKVRSSSTSAIHAVKSKYTSNEAIKYLCLAWQNCTQYGGSANKSGHFLTYPNCQIGDTNTICSLVIGSQLLMWCKFGHLCHQSVNWGTVLNVANFSVDNFVSRKLIHIAVIPWLELLVSWDVNKTSAPAPCYWNKRTLLNCGHLKCTCEFCMWCVWAWL